MDKENVYLAYQQSISKISNLIQPLHHEKKKKVDELESISKEIANTVEKIDDANKLLYNLERSLQNSQTAIEVFSEKLYKAIEDQTGKMQCIICREKTRSITFEPYYHFISCSTCSSKVLECPTCKQHIKSRHTTYF